jgi:hypothetical protein
MDRQHNGQKKKGKRSVSIVKYQHMLAVPDWKTLSKPLFYRKKFEDTNEVIRSRKSKMDRQHNGQKKKGKQQ